MRPVSILALVVLTSLPLGAALENSYRPATLPWSDTVQLDTFDPATGELVGVRLLVDSFVRAELRAENQSDVYDLVHAQCSAVLRVALPNGQTIAQMPFDAGTTWALAPFDGKSDFDGASGQSARPSGRGHTEVLIDDPAMLLYFQGPFGGGGTVELPVSAQALTSILGGSNLLQFTEPSAGMRVSVEYFSIP